MSGLHLAAKEGHLSVVMELLNRGANCAARTRVRDMPFFFSLWCVFKISRKRQKCIKIASSMVYEIVGCSMWSPQFIGLFIQLISFYLQLI